MVMRVYFLFYSIMGHAMTITLLYRNRRFDSATVYTGQYNIGNVIIIRIRIVIIIIIIVIYAKLKNLYSSGDNFITKILFDRARSNHGFVMNRIFITDDVTRQRLISRRPIDGWYEGSALSLRRLSNEVEEQIVRLNNAP